MKQDRLKTILTILAVLAVLTGLRLLLKEAVFLALGRTPSSDRVASAIAMALLTVGGLLVCRFKRMPLKVFPERWTIWYTLATVVAGALLVATPILTRDAKPFALFLLVYSAVLTPVFEELIFRGYVWERLETAFASKWAAYLLSTVLFALWHFTYVDSLSLRVHADALGNAMLWKAITGLGFGAVLGFLRVFARNCYATMLLHGVMNIFGR